MSLRLIAQLHHVPASLPSTSTTPTYTADTPRASLDDERSCYPQSDCAHLPHSVCAPMRTVIRPNISHRHVSSAQAEIIIVATVVATNSFCSSQPGAMLLLIPISIPTTLYSHTTPCADEFGNQSVAMVVLICSHFRCLSLSQHESLFLEQTLCGVHYYMLTPVKTREL